MKRQFAIAMLAALVTTSWLHAQTEESRVRTLTGDAVTGSLIELDSRIQGDLRTTVPLQSVLFVQNNPLGMLVQPLEEELAAQMQIKPQGLIVTNIDGSSVAEKAGLKKYDILLRLADTELKSESELIEAAKSQAGQAAPLLLRRAGRDKLLVVQIPQQPQAVNLAYSLYGADQKESRYRLGFVLGEIDEALRSQLLIPEGQGVILTEIRPDSPASKAGLLKNDILIEINGKAAESIDKVRESIQENGDKDAVLKVVRGGKAIQVLARPVLTAESAEQQVANAREFLYHIVADQTNQNDAIKYQRVWKDAAQGLDIATELSAIRESLAKITAQLEKLAK